MLHTVADLLQELFRSSEPWTFLSQEVYGLFQDLSCGVVGRVLILHELVLQKGRQVLEVVAFDPGQVQQAHIVDAPNRSSSPALEKITDFAKNATWLNLAHIILTAGEVSTCDSALAFREEVECCRGASLTDHDVLGQLLQRLTHSTDELHFSLKHRV